MAFVQIKSKILRLCHKHQNKGKRIALGRLFCSQLTAVATSSTESTLTDEQLHSKGNSPKKLLRVAIMGRPNAGKSTLINKIVETTICDVSRKSHATRFPLRTALTKGDTQILFMDTPGIVTKSEAKKFRLGKEFLSGNKRNLQHVDVLAMIYDVLSLITARSLEQRLQQHLENVPQSMPVVLIINKIDLGMKEKYFQKVVDELDEMQSQSSGGTWRFSRVFFISALQNKGVNEVVNYLMEQAKPGEWAFKPEEVCDVPLHTLMKRLLRAKMLDLLRGEVPYKCTYDVEYLEEKDTSVKCVAVITCDKTKYKDIIVGTRKLKDIARELESDLFKILLKHVFMDIVVVVKPKEADTIAKDCWTTG